MRGHLPPARPVPLRPPVQPKRPLHANWPRCSSTHATLDGREVTGVRAIDKCHTAFITAGGETVIDWAKADNPAPRNAGGREITQLPGKDGSHSMSAEQGDLPEPGGNAANRSTGAFGQLALDCGG